MGVHILLAHKQGNLQLHVFLTCSIKNTTGPRGALLSLLLLFKEVSLEFKFTLLTFSPKWDKAATLVDDILENQ